MQTAGLAAGVTGQRQEPGNEAASALAKLLLADRALAAYWRFEGDLTDAKGRFSGSAEHGRIGYIPGPVAGGKAVELQDGAFINFGPTPQLDLPATSIELFFKLTGPLPGRYNPCIVAKRAGQKETRFSVHVIRDLEHLAVWNGSRVFQFRVPAGKLAIGRWYHLAITWEAGELQMFVDGVPCEGPPVGTFNRTQRRLPLLVGSSTTAGTEWCPLAVDELAIFARRLTEEQIVEHLAAAGWSERIAAARSKREKALAERRRLAQQRLRQLRDERLLFERGSTKIYRGEQLTGISIGIGGIGTGAIYMNGKAERTRWQIFNSFETCQIPDSFFAIAARPAAERRAGRGAAAAEAAGTVLRALQTSPAGPFEAMSELTFKGEYPFGWYEFSDKHLPVAVRLEAYNPFVPLAVRDSAIPAALYNITVTNTSDRPVQVTVLGTQQNAVGYRGKGAIRGRRYSGYGGNVNRIIAEPAGTFLHMSNRTIKPQAPNYGDMALAVLGERAAGTADWRSLEELAGALARDGALPAGPKQAGPSPLGLTLNGALAVTRRLERGQSHTVRFALTWHFPNGRHGGPRGWSFAGNMYANWWPNALAVARELADRAGELERLTRLFHDTFYATNLPRWLLDRISSQLAVLRSQTCFWSADGYFGGWEGCQRTAGCCYGNCAHVWHYAQAHARLFPELGRRMREQALRYQAADGSIPFRQPAHKAATDGQFGELLGCYREHLMSRDGSWLKRHWPRIKKAMDYAIATWDADEDGVLAGPQHNTLDGELGGSSSWLGSLYLAALAAAERMAELQGDRQAAARYRRIRSAGAKNQERTLFNGEYYIQIPDPQPREDYRDGCHIDQVLGQWWALQLGLEPVYDPQRVRTALRALVKYNFKPRFEGVVQLPRKFVADDDAGLQMITWPHGPRPYPHTRYADEVMTGFEYSAAAAMIQAGLLLDGFMVVRAIYERYDGRRRDGLTAAAWGYSGNPFGDDECGKFYARAMSVWSLLLAAQGYIYDGPAGRIGFKPLWQPQQHRSFFTAAEGWGLYEQRRSRGSQQHELTVKHGKLTVKELIFELRAGQTVAEAKVTAAGRPLEATCHRNGQEVLIRLKQPTTITADQTMTVDLRLRGSA